MTFAGRKRRLDFPARALAALVLLCAPAAAQQTSSIEPSPETARAEYEQLSREITLSDERAAQLAADIAKLRKDEATLTAALIQSAKTEKKLSEDVDVITERLAPLRAQEETVQASLAARSDVLAEVLGALERMGLNPPPALLVSPEDALSSVRSAILLGAVVPELRAETESLMASLAELQRLSQSIRAERERLAAAVVDQIAERRRLAMLQNEKRRLQAENAAAIEGERARSAELAAKAGSLKELIAALEKEAARKAEAEARARKEEAARLQREEELAAMPVPDDNQLVGAIPFDALKGEMALPAPGRVARRFGSNDDNGAVMQGDTVATQSGAIVTAPADGRVLYAGPFRSFGQLLILDAGGGYHVVLAGLGRITVAQGQAVLSGEPVGAMGDSRIASASADPAGGRGPELYVEFRKGGKPLDPAPWWARRGSGRT